MSRYTFALSLALPSLQLELVDTIKITIKKKRNMKINQHETDQYGKIKTIYREKMIERTE